MADKSTEGTMRPQGPATPRVEEKGLSDEEAARRAREGHANTQRTRTTRTVGAIIRDNVFTLFNAIILTAMAVVLLTGRWKDAVFGFVIIINSAIGIVTELKSKRTLDRLSILVASTILVRRDGRDVEIPAEQIVQDDVIWIRTGEQVPADSQILHSWGLELDESMLTGESRTIRKKPGDKALSGSTAVSGLALARVTAVGADSYAAKLTAQAKVFTRTRSDLQEGINTILKTMTFIVVPLCILLIVTQMARVGGWSAAIASGAWKDAVVSSVAGVVGMIPEGLVLLTSLNFAIAAMRLARQNTLVQELEAVETLARVDCLNLDKTGTITDGGIELSSVRLLDETGDADASAALAALEAVCDEATPNITGAAVLSGLRSGGYHLVAHDGRKIDEARPGGDGREAEPPAERVTGRVPFSSARKWSGARIDQTNTGQGAAGARTWYLGAPEVILSQIEGKHPGVEKAIADTAATGARVLLLAATPPAAFTPLADGAQKDTRTPAAAPTGAPGPGLSRTGSAGEGKMGLSRTGSGDGENPGADVPSRTGNAGEGKKGLSHTGSGEPGAEGLSRTGSAGEGNALAASGERAGLEERVDPGARPVALVVCAESVRADAQATLSWFREQGVRCRVISGDNPLTVAAVARCVGLTGDREPRAVDARDLPGDVDELAQILEDVDVVGRVLPAQKKLIVQALHASGHTVAMTGDGVNDTLALKEADLGIAMGNAAPAAKAVAQVVLVDSRFSHLPDVVARGRQVMANMERVASLFLAKTAYSALISLGVVLTGIPFPYLPRHITYVGGLTIGAPAFILALAPNTRRYVPGFLRRVLRFAVPCGVGIALSLLSCAWIMPSALGLDMGAAGDVERLRQTCVIILFVLSVLVLARVASPLRSWRGLLVLAFAAAGLVGMCIGPVASFFDLGLPTGAWGAATLAALAASVLVFAMCVAVGGRIRAPRRAGARRGE